MVNHITISLRIPPQSLTSSWILRGPFRYIASIQTQTAASELPREHLGGMMPSMLWHALALLALCNGQLTTEEEIQVPLGNGDWIHLSQFCQVCNENC